MIAYLDTSSLVKLYLDEPGSAGVVDLVASASDVTTSIVAYSESRATFARLRRTGDITRATANARVAQLDADWRRMITIDVTASIAQRAGQLADRFDLRGFDAIHLASFELVLERSEGDVHFSSADLRLVKAAKRLG